VGKAFAEEAWTSEELLHKKRNFILVMLLTFPFWSGPVKNSAGWHAGLQFGHTGKEFS
jgi:hypothetical protein